MHFITKMIFSYNARHPLKVQWVGSDLVKKFLNLKTVQCSRQYDSGEKIAQGGIGEAFLSLSHKYNRDEITAHWFTTTLVLPAPFRAIDDSF